jgi:hypothetical protein
MCRLSTLFRSQDTNRAGREYASHSAAAGHDSIADINHPLHLMPVETSDRIEDLKFALHDVNLKFDHIELVKQAILQAADLRKQQEEKYKK